MSPTNMTLVKVAALGGLATISMGMLWKSKVTNNIQNTVYYKEALKTVRTHKGAVHLLGEPIKERTLDVGDTSKNYTKENNAQYEVPVKGPKQKGTVLFWASRLNKDSEWKLNRVELGLDSDPDKRLIIKSV